MHPAEGSWIPHAVPLAPVQRRPHRPPGGGPPTEPATRPGAGSSRRRRRWPDHEWRPSGPDSRCLAGRRWRGAGHATVRRQYQTQPHTQWTVSIGSILLRCWPQFGHWRVHIPHLFPGVPGCVSVEQARGQGRPARRSCRSAHAYRRRRADRHPRESTGVHRVAQCG